MLAVTGVPVRLKCRVSTISHRKTTSQFGPVSAASGPQLHFTNVRKLTPFLHVRRFGRCGNVREPWQVITSKLRFDHTASNHINTGGGYERIEMTPVGGDKRSICATRSFLPCRLGKAPVTRGAMYRRWLCFRRSTVVRPNDDAFCEHTCQKEAQDESRR